MKDLIDERNFKEASRRSIIKWWDVRMVNDEIPASDHNEMTQSKDDELGDFFKMSEAEQERVRDIMQRLEEEAKQDEYEKQLEIEEVRKRRELVEKGFNISTNSMSGDYGKNPVENTDELARIQAILGEKDSAFKNTIEEAAKHQNE